MLLLTPRMLVLVLLVLLVLLVVPRMLMLLLELELMIAAELLLLAGNSNGLIPYRLGLRHDVQQWRGAVIFVGCVTPLWLANVYEYGSQTW